MIRFCRAISISSACIAATITSHSPASSVYRAVECNRPLPNQEQTCAYHKSTQELTQYDGQVVLVYDHIRKRKAPAAGFDGKLLNQVVHLLLDLAHRRAERRRFGRIERATDVHADHVHPPRRSIPAQ